MGPGHGPLTARKFEPTPERLERGRCIFMGLSACVRYPYSHGPVAAWLPPLPEMIGAGQVLPKLLPGRIVAPNLTPDAETGAGNWTDDQLARAIREGIGHDGRALFPMMPYQNFRELSDEDLASIVVFIRSLPPIRHELPKTEVRVSYQSFDQLAAPARHIAGECS